MLLEMKNITKTYGPVVANDRVSLSLNKGEILAIVGENGAGKSTIMKILYGLEEADSGEIYLNNNLVNFRSPQDAIENKIGMVQQHFMLFRPFTVAENIVWGDEPRKHGLFFDINKACKIVGDLSEEYGLDIDPSLRIEDCPVGLQQRVEILKVLYQSAEIIIFDEPSAVLTPQEVTELLKTIRRLAQLGKSIILITHKLQEVMNVADRVMVMRNGKYVDEKMVGETNIEELSYLMVGRQLVEKKIQDQETGDMVLEVKNVTYVDYQDKKQIDDLSLHVRSGEIVGIAGVSGNGQSELIGCITGINKVKSGSIIVDKEDVTGQSVYAIRKAGCACIPEDRYQDGCAKEATLTETVLMGHQSKETFSNKGILKTRSIEGFAKDQFKRFNVRYNSINQRASELSGGNLQKVIAAREIAQGTRLLIAAEPTRGVDIGAMEFIHEKLLDKRSKGDGVLLISSELSEIMGLSDRIYVIYKGKIVGEFSRNDVSSAKLGLLMMGGSLK